MVWETLFMLLILKIPVAYLCVVVWWAIRAQPLREEPAALVGAHLPPPSSPARRGSGRAPSWRRGGPSRRPGRRPARRGGVPG